MELAEIMEWFHFKVSEVLGRVILLTLYVPLTVGSIEDSACKVPPHVTLMDNLDILPESALLVICLK